MLIKTNATCEALFLHIYTDSDEQLNRVAQRLRLKPKEEDRSKYFTDTTFYKRITFKLHDNVTIYIYGIEHKTEEIIDDIKERQK